ncbi:hypothetical protein PIB30_001125 [Stylosanthes scabra]|uniref:BHLH domain-containing protein n=1 Tax=Stylosanthes scabra TaxID=79078 RepID=A0ABU6U4K3_9FABA|nr:hypothetical protein [Stylosanthes scabra]
MVTTHSMVHGPVVIFIRRRKPSSSSSMKVERKIVERNRRELFKSLHFKLNSLLPNHNPRDVLPRAEKVEDAIRYIKSLEERVKIANEKKESLLRIVRNKSGPHETHGLSLTKTPAIEIHELGSMLEIVLMTSGIDNQFIFKEIIRILHEENIEVLSANSSLAGDAMLHVVHAKTGQFFQFGTSKVSERLKIFVNGHFQDLEGEHNFRLPTFNFPPSVF